MVDLKFDQNEVRFCSFCGTRLDVGARFCKNCGKTVGQSNQFTAEVNTATQLEYEKFSHELITERKIVYEGNLHKCPNCGEVLEAFVANCPSCGHEIRDKRSSSSVRELAMKLERIEAQKMPAFEEKKSVMKMVFGKDLNDEDEVEKAREHFEEQKKHEKANIIINYSVPNTKEDIMEFMLLASSNINVKYGIDDVVTKAWISKLEQVYEKAKLSMGNSSDFIQIERIYDQKKKQIKDKKIRGFLIGISCVAGWFFLWGLLWNPRVTVAIAVVLIILLIIGFILFKKGNLYKDN